MSFLGLLSAVACVLGVVVAAGIVFSIWDRWVARSPMSTPEPTSGPLCCPYCGKRILSHVEYMGQRTTCPDCFSSFEVGSARLQREIAAQIWVMLLSIALLVWVLFFWS